MFENNDEKYFRTTLRSCSFLWPPPQLTRGQDFAFAIHLVVDRRESSSGRASLGGVLSGGCGCVRVNCRGSTTGVAGLAGPAPP